MTLTVALWLLLTAAAPAGAGSASVAPASSKLEQGQRAFASGDFKAALTALDAAASESTDASTLEKVHLLRAQAFAATSAFAKAEEACALALDANPLASLDPARVDPALVKMLDAMRARLSGSVSLHSTPETAAFTIDGAAVGQGLARHSLAIGKHEVLARWPDGQEQSLSVLVRNKRELFVEWVQAKPVAPKVVEVPVAAPAAAKRRLVTPFADVRGMLDTLGATVGPEGGFELGAGIELPYSRVAVYARLYSQFHLVPRLSAVVPVLDRPDTLWSLAVFAELEVPVMLRAAGLGVGLGGAAGLEWRPTRWLAPYVQIGGRHLFINVGNNVDDRFTFAGGLRLLLP